MNTRVVVVGGVAGGMSCATRIKRLNQAIEVTVFERGADVSFANCGMPYYVGGIIASRDKLLVQTPAALHGRYGLDIRTRHEVTAIDRAGCVVQARNLDTGEIVQAPYDYLVLAPGAEPIRPPLPGADAPHVFVLNTLQDMDAIGNAAASARAACVVGGGFIGLELVENLAERGLAVTVVERLDHVMPRLDVEMATPLHQELEAHGVTLRLGSTVTAVEPGAVILDDGARVPADMVCLCVGVRPRSAIARDAGLETDPRGFIVVDRHMRTSDPRVFAVGDATLVHDFVTGERVAVPLAGPANRQGRIAADNICGRDSEYTDAQGTSIVKVFGLVAAQTGINEVQLRAAGSAFHRVYTHPTQRPGYYPGAKPIGIKLLFDAEGVILGAQAVGEEGVDVIIDVLATAMRGNLTVFDLEHLELAYSPQWGGAKHGLNMLGFVAANVLRGDVQLIEADDAPGNILWLDVRNPNETAQGTLDGAILIPLNELRARAGDLPRGREIGVYCAAGLRGYLAYRFLVQDGFKVRNLNGGYRTWSWFHP